MKFEIDFKDYNINGKNQTRTAARGLICTGDDYLCIQSKYGDFTFPGGGVEKGETLEQALIREVREETGYIVIPETIKYFGSVHERRTWACDEIMDMYSNYYFCEVEPVAGELLLTDDEKDFEYKRVWSTLRNAVEYNRKEIDMKRFFWVERETRVMEYLINNNL